METETEYGVLWPAEGAVEPAARRFEAEQLVAQYPQWDGQVMARTITKSEWQPA